MNAKKILEDISSVTTGDVIELSPTHSGKVFAEVGEQIGDLSKFKKKDIKELAVQYSKYKDFGNLDAAVAKAYTYAQKLNSVMILYPSNSYMTFVWVYNYPHKASTVEMNNRGESFYLVNPNGLVFKSSVKR